MSEKSGMATPFDPDKIFCIALKAERGIMTVTSVENLRSLLQSQDEQIIKIGIWIASELGIKCYPLLGDVITLLNHRMKYVRFFAIDCVLSCSTKNDGAAVAKVMLLLNDNESSVRWKAMQFLMRASADQLRGALSYFEGTEKDSIHIPGIRLLIGAGEKNPQDIILFMQNEQPVLRKYGVGAAARILEYTDNPLRLVLTSDDQEIKDFAKDVFQLKRSRQE